MGHKINTPDPRPSISMKHKQSCPIKHILLKQNSYIHKNITVFQSESKRKFYMAKYWLSFQRNIIISTMYPLNNGTLERKKILDNSFKGYLV